MSDDTKRLFVGNLPNDTSEDELKSEFAHYGAVKLVDVKQQKDVDTGNIKSTFAFVTISINDRMLDRCLNEFSQEKFHGNFLKVSVARENFLDRLKREREEAAQSNATRNAQNEKSGNVATDVKVALPTLAAASGSSSSSSEESDSEDEVSTVPQSKPKSVNGNRRNSSDSESSANEDNELVLRKKSKIFLKNGKIQIDRNVSAGEAIHVIEQNANKSTKKSLDEKSQKADQKRIESMKKMKDSYNEQKLAIKNALTGVDSSKRNNKIVFDDDDNAVKSNNVAVSAAEKVPSASKSKEKATSKKPVLFADDDDEDDDAQNYENDFQIKEHFQGVKGEKLMRLQSRFQNDQRFNMDARFLEDDDNEDNDNVAGKQHQSKNGREETNDEDGVDERRWQYDILESVIGKKVRRNEPPKESTKRKAPSTMLHFDPTCADHTKYVETTKKRPKKTLKDELQAKRRKLNDADDGDDEPNDAPPPVSMDQFYEIRGDLKNLMGSGGFSLLSMFGRSGDDAIAAKASIDATKYEEKPIAKNTAKFLHDLDPFRYDSSGDEADIGEPKKKRKTTADADSKPTINGSIWHESFFIHKTDDERFNEGIAFFVSSTIDGEQPQEIDETKKQELRNIVKRKIKKSVKNALPRHVKPNKRFKRFTKNL